MSVQKDKSISVEDVSLVYELDQKCLYADSYYDIWYSFFSRKIEIQYIRKLKKKTEKTVAGEGIIC